MFKPRGTGRPPSTTPHRVGRRQDALRCLLPSLLVLLSPSPAAAGEVGVGGARVFDPWAAGIELHLGDRVPLGPALAIEGRGAYVVAPDGRLASLPYELAAFGPLVSQVDALTQPVWVGAWRLELLVDLAPPRDPLQVQLVPHLRVGVGVEGQLAYTLDTTSDAGEAELAGSRIAVPAVAELAQELWGGRGLGLRGTVGLVAQRAPLPGAEPGAPVDGRELSVRTRLGLELLVDVGGRR